MSRSGSARLTIFPPHLFSKDAQTTRRNLSPPARFPDLDDRERILLKISANLFESYYEIKNPRNQLTIEEYEKVPGRWELMHGMLID
jgi:hypothetical protein